MWIIYFHYKSTSQLVPIATCCINCSIFFFFFLLSIQIQIHNLCKKNESRKWSGVCYYTVCDSILKCNVEARSCKTQTYTKIQKGNGSNVGLTGLCVCMDTCCPAVTFISLYITSVIYRKNSSSTTTTKKKSARSHCSISCPLLFVSGQ